MALCNIAVGGRIGYSTGDTLRLLEDIQILKPTFVAAVPRVLNRVYQVAMATASAPGLKGKLFRHATEVKVQQLRSTGQRTHALYDRLVFSKVGVQRSELPRGTVPYLGRDRLQPSLVAGSSSCRAALHP